MSKRNQHNMPDGFEPPVPAWSADWDDGPVELTIGIFGAQSAECADFESWASSAFDDSEHAPLHVDRASFIDKRKLPNRVYIAYWPSDVYETWWLAERPGSIWDHESPSNENSAGIYREIISVPSDHLETLHSTPNAHGVATLARRVEGPVDEHAYSGASRDRIAISSEKDLRGQEVVFSDMLKATRLGDTQILIKPAARMCVIRSGQDWSHCSERERDFYLGEVAPSLEAGMGFLSANPEETRCLSMRLMRGCDSSGAELKQTFGLGFALDIYAFEEWAKSHPTHLEIFEKFMGHAQQFGESMQLRLWHEIAVIDNDVCEFEYIGCHEETGLIPYAAI